MAVSPANAAHAWTASSAPVRAIVRRAWRAAVLRRAIESSTLGVAAALVCRAASLASGGAGATNAWIAACSVGSLAALSWWLEHAPEESAVARRLDGDGALLTAYECERSGVDSPLRALLSQRVASALAASTPRLARAPSPIVLAVVLGAAAVLALAIESSDAPARSGPLDARRAAFAESAEALAAAVDGESQQLSSEDSAEVRDLARSAADLARTRGDAIELSAFASRAEAAGRERTAGSRLGEALDDAAARARALSTALTVVTGGDSGGGSASRNASDRGVEGTPRAGEGSGVGTGMHPGTSDVTMLRPDSAAAPDPAARAAEERGLPAVRWWPRRFDAIVERWVERQRTTGDR